jgi:MFS family permease
MTVQATDTRGATQPYLRVSVALMLIATAVLSMQYKLPTIIPQVVEQGLLDMPTITILMSIFTFAGIFFAIPAGVLVERIGARKALIVTVIIECVSAPVIFIGNPFILILFRLFEGIAFSLLLVAGPVIIQQNVHPSKHGIATGIWSLGGTMGAVTSGMATPALFGMAGLPGVWIGYAIFCLVCGCIFVALVKAPASVRGKALASAKEAGERRLAETDGAMVAAREGDGTKVPYRRLLRKNILFYLFGYAVFHTMLLGYLSFVPTFLQQQGFDPALAGTISILPMLISIVSALAFGMIADKTGRAKPLYLLGYAAMCLSVFLIFWGTQASLWIGIVAMGLLSMGILGIGVAAFPRLLSDRRLIPVGMGVFIVTQSLGQFLGTAIPPVLLGPGIDQWATMSYVLAGAGILGLISSALCRFK